MEITRFKKISRLASAFAFLFLFFMIHSSVQSTEMKSVLVSNQKIEVQPVPENEIIDSDDVNVDTVTPVIPSVQETSTENPAEMPGSVMTAPDSTEYFNQQPQTVTAQCCECGTTVIVPFRSRKTLAENVSALTCFNCRTNGSYKFPVPRQYTYFWPGIYSQKTMTEYVSPYHNYISPYHHPENPQPLTAPNEVWGNMPDNRGAEGNY